MFVGSKKTCHLSARVHPTNKIANHAGWQGKVYKIHGEDPEYPNLKESTGYPGDILGLGGVNCRHRMFPFVPGISTPNPIGFSEEENRKAYELSQQQRKLERDMRKLKKKKAAAKASGDKETEKKLGEKIKLKSDEIDKFCEDNKLKRDYNRELVTEQITKKVAKAEKILDKNPESGKIISFEIGRSLGAAAKNYPIKLPESRQHTKLAEGQKIEGTAFAGKGTPKEIRDRFRLESTYGIPADEWEKVSGKAEVIVNGKPVKAEIHWYQANDEIFEMKVKRFFDEG